jgi:hypothetical protein
MHYAEMEVAWFLYLPADDKVDKLGYIHCVVPIMMLRSVTVAAAVFYLFFIFFERAALTIF